VPLVSMRQLLDHAAENGYGLPAFNVNNLEQVQAIMEAANETGSPVIMQASAGARKYAGETFLKHLIQAAVDSYPHIPIVMHQDHGQSAVVCESAMKLGFSSVMMDGSLKEDGKTIAEYDYNVDVTRNSSALRTPGASRWKANWAASDRWKPCAATRRTATARKSP
jgi:fructose-bisphosphate aldolase, class II